MSASSEFFCQPVTLSLSTLLDLMQTAAVCAEDTQELAAQVSDAWLLCPQDDPNHDALRLVSMVLDGQVN